MKISSKKAGNLSQRRDWTTPSLTDDGPTTTPTETPTTTPTRTPTDTPTVGQCTAVLRDGSRWNDRFNSEVTVTGSSDWTVVVSISSPQTVSTVWNGSVTWNSSKTLMTVKPDGNGNVFGFTTMANGNWTRPQIRSCTAS